MQLTYMSSASVLIKDQDVKLLTDPWYVDGEFYGTWYNYPPCTVNLKELENIDGITFHTYIQIILVKKL